MKRTLLLAGLLTGATLHAKALPTPPASCAADIAAVGYCSTADAPPFKGAVDLRFFVVIDKASFATVDDVLNRYLSFNTWPAFAESTGTEDLVFTKSIRMPTVQVNGTTVYRHYYDYKLKSPIGYQKVRGVTFNSKVAAYPGALASVEFAAQIQGPQAVPAGEKPLNGVEGVQLQVGSVHAVDCDGRFDFCGNNQYLLMYESKIQPDIDLLPKVAAASISKGIEALLVGMWFNNIPVPAAQD